MKKLAILSIILIAFILPVYGDDQGDHGQIIVSSVSGFLEVGRPAIISVELMNNASGKQSSSIFGDNETCLGVMAELHSSDDRIHVLSAPQVVGSLAPGENRSVEFVANPDQGMDVGVYPLVLLLSYSRLSGVKATGNIPDVLFNYESVNDILPLNVKVILGPRLDLEVNDLLAPGTETDLTLHFVNHGDEPISDLQVQPLPQDPFTLVENKINLGSIDPGGSVSARFRVFTANNTADGYYALPCSVSYKCGQLDHNDELAAIVAVKERSWSNIMALPMIIIFLVGAVYLVIKARKGRKRLRKRL
ncbi:MAG: hypothetical protein WB392_04855 [Methanotrichaceae archaeon]